MEQTVAMYCFIDDFLRVCQPRWVDRQRHLSDAKVLTTALMAAPFSVIT